MINMCFLVNISLTGKISHPNSSEQFIKPQIHPLHSHLHFPGSRCCSEDDFYKGQTEFSHPGSLTPNLAHVPQTTDEKASPREAVHKGWTDGGPRVSAPRARKTNIQSRCICLKQVTQALTSQRFPQKNSVCPRARILSLIWSSESTWPPTSLPDFLVSYFNITQHTRWAEPESKLSLCFPDRVHISVDLAVSSRSRFQVESLGRTMSDFLGSQSTGMGCSEPFTQEAFLGL